MRSRGDADSPSRWLDVVAVVLLVGAAFRPPLGLTSFDTKTDLWVDPAAFLRRSLHLWNPDASFGELQNQAYGYLFPQGAFALAGQSVGLQPWLTQRLWQATLLVVAYLGVRACARLILQTPGRPSPEVGAVVAGLAYAVAPRLLGIVGVISSEATPPALLPWLAVPVLLHARGRIGARAAGLACGLAVLCMGAVNAVATVACLPLLVLAVLLVRPSRDRRALALWTGVGVAAASAWWAAPLLLLGRYSPPFLDFIETSAAATSPLGWSNVLRGATHWVAFTDAGDEPWWPGAYDLHATVPGILASGAVLLLGLTGLVVGRVPQRRLLLASLGLGAALLVAGHGGVLGSPLAEPVRWLLDGPLAMLRNVHKVDPLLRWPLAIGAGYAVERLLVPLAAGGLAAATVRRRALPACALVTVSLLTPLALAPGHMPGWSDYPDMWREASVAAADAARGRTTLVLPVAAVGRQQWGWTVDEPVQPVAAGPWVSRSQVPLAPPQTIRFLDALTARAEEGGEHVADALSRAGIGAVILRRDEAADVVDPAVTERVRAALDRSPGIRLVGGFGPERTLVVYSVQPGPSRVQVVDARQVGRIRGAPEDVLAALELGLVDPRTPVVMAGDDAFLEPSDTPTIVADGDARRERAFGSVRDALGPVLSAGQPFVADRPVHDYPGVPGTPPVLASYSGLRDLRSSSSAADPDVLVPLRPEHGAQAAVDGDPLTQWWSNPWRRPTDQWVEAVLPGPRALPHVDVVAGVNALESVPVRELTVTTDDGQRVSRAVDPVTGKVRIPLSGHPVRTVRIGVTKAFLDPDVGSVAVSEVVLPGVEIERRLVVPAARAGAAGFLFRQDPGRRACLPVDGVVRCDATQERDVAESGGLSRRVTLEADGSFDLTGRVRARATAETAELFAGLGDDANVVADSVYGDDPAVAGRFAMDDDPSTAWLARPFARSATLDVTLSRPATVTTVAVAGSTAGMRLPVRARVASGGVERVVELSGETPAVMSPLTGRRFTVTLDAPPGLGAPLGVGELRLGGAEDQVRSWDRGWRTGDVCGLGPRLVVDGTAHDTEVRGSLGDVVDGTDLALRLCDRPVRLTAGPHDISIERSARYLPYEVGLTASTSPAEPASRPVSVVSWTRGERTIDAPAGDSALVATFENFNMGWTARAGGTVLRPVRVDGWRQGFVLPAGVGGRVSMTFGPDTAYRALLLGGGLLALCLVAGATWALLRDSRRAWVDVRSSPRAASRRPAPVVILLVAGLAGGAGVLCGALLSGTPLLRRRRPAVGLCLVGLSFVLAAADAATGGSPAFVPWWVDLPAALGVGVVVMHLAGRASAEEGPRPAEDAS